MRLLSHNNSADNEYARLDGRNGQFPPALSLSTDSPAPETAKPHMETKGLQILSKIGRSGLERLIGTGNTIVWGIVIIVQEHQTMRILC